MKFPKLYLITGLITAVVIFLVSCTSEPEKRVASPDGKITVDLSVNDSGNVFYSVKYADMPVMSNNQLGIAREGADFTSGMKLISVSETEPVKDNYTLLYGKKTNIEYHADKKVYNFENSTGKKMDIIFQVSNDGVAFRYYFPDESEDIKKISKEITSYQFDKNTLAWIQPIAKAKTGWNGSNPSYEEYYSDGTLIDSLPENDPGWVFPALFKTGNFWVSLTETAPDRNYCGCRLQPDKGQSRFRIGFPEPVEDFMGGPVYPQSTLPWATPWRIITIGENPGTLIQSTLGTDLAKPAIEGDFSFVKPGRSSWSWVLYKDDSTVFSVQKRFVDYASDMGWEYCLVDADWDKKIGYEKLGELCKYAATKNVGIIVWYNSAGNWNTTPYSPRDKMLTKESREAEFTKLKALGVKAIKVDFFGAEGQSMMDYYQDIITDAARFGLMVNCHGSTFPRGQERTYPNLVSMESIRGFEYVTFEQANADSQPKHCTIIPFTRNLYDPMDFTPVCFSEVPNIKRRTSNAFELALSVLFNSGIQHYAEVPEGMAKVPAEVKQLLKDIPAGWDETRFLDGYPGSYVILARRKGNTWYITGINGKPEKKNVSLDLSFLTNPESVLFVTDGKTNRSFTIKKDIIDFSKPFVVDIQPDGGFLMQIKLTF